MLQVDVNLFQIIPPTHEDLAAHLSFLSAQEFCTAVNSTLLYLRQKTWTGRNALLSGIDSLRKAQTRHIIAPGPDSRPYPDDQAGSATVLLLPLSHGNNKTAVYNSAGDLYSCIVV